MIPSSGCPPWPPDHPRTLPRTGTPTPPRGARPEVVRPAREEGPQRVTVRGQDAVGGIAADEFERLLPRPDDAVPFVTFMESLTVDGLDLTRDRDTGRDVEL